MSRRLRNKRRTELNRAARVQREGPTPVRRAKQKTRRALRHEQQAGARLRLDRQSLDPDLTLAQERGLLGALILEPAMIGVMAPLRPPAWFTHESCLAVMRALYCISHRLKTLTDLIEALERHDALELAGGRDAVEALVQPGPNLDAGLAALAEARAQMRSVDDEEIVRIAGHLLRAEPSRPTSGDHSLGE